MSITRTFTVTVVSTGAGNKYFIDGVQQATINLAEGGVYKFDVSDSSVSGHPFRFSTTSDGSHGGGSEYTTGVTTSGNAGDVGAYVQISVANSAPTLYYYCTAHSGMGGQANTPASDTWGVLTWSENSWSAQNDVSVSVTGVSTTINVLGENLARYSKDFTNSAWNRRNVGATKNVGLAPDGTNTANLVNELTNVNNHFWEFNSIFPDNNIAGTFSVYFKKGTGANAPDWIQITSGGGQVIYANFNLTTGAVGNYNTPSAPTMIDVGNGWYRCIAPVNGAGSATSYILAFTNNVNTTQRYNPSTYAGQTDADVLVWGAQVEQNSISNFKPTVNAAVSSSLTLQANADVSVTGIQTTVNFAGENQVVNSVDLDSSFPNQFRATVTSNAALSPFGTKDATTLTGNGVDTGTKVLFKFGFNTPSPGDIQTFSIFAKNSAGGTGGTFQMEIGNSAQRANVQFNISNGVRTGTAQSSEVSFIEGDSVDYGDGWYRFRLTVRYESSFDKPNTNVGIQLNGSAADDPGVILFGAQVEEQTALTNYKPTFGTAVSSIFAGGTSVDISQSGISVSSSIGTLVPGTGDVVNLTTAGLLSSSIGTPVVTAIIEEGWGGDSWGENSWGELQPNFVVTGSSASTSIGSVTTQANSDADVTGIATTVNFAGTNFQAYSQDLSQSNYTKRGNCTATANYGIAPDGTKTSTLIDNIQGNNTPGGTYSDVFDVIATNYSASGEALEASFYIKRVSGSSTALQFNNPQNAAQGSWNINFNSLSTTEWTRIDKNHSAVTVTNTYTSSDGGQAGTHFKLDANSSEDLSFEVWGIQIEEGTAVTNYKRTLGTAVNSIPAGGTSVDVLVTGQTLTATGGEEDIGIGVPVTGSSLSSSVGTATVDENYLIGSGWGRDAWGTMVWGDAYSVQTGSVSATTSVGSIESITADANVTPTGQVITSSSGQLEITGDANLTLTGISLTSSVGPVSTFNIVGNQANMSISPVDINADGNQFVNVFEDQLDTAVNSINIDIGVSPEAVGSSLTTSIGSISQITANADVVITGIELTSSIGNEIVTADGNVVVSGSSLTTSIGTETVQANADVPVTGSSLAGSTGQVSQVTTYEVTGVAMTMAMGEENTVINVEVDVTGQALTTSISGVNIAAWSEIDPGVANIWTPVDLAA